MKERYGDFIFASVCYVPVKKARFTVMTINGEEGVLAVVWIAKIVVLLRLRSKRGGEER